MQHYLILCRSLTYAQRAQRAVERAGVTGTLVKAPQDVTGGGCTYGVRVPTGKVDIAVEVIRKAGLPMGKIYRYEPDGSLKEVRL